MVYPAKEHSLETRGTIDSSVSLSLELRAESELERGDSSNETRGLVFFFFADGIALDGSETHSRGPVA